MENEGEDEGGKNVGDVLLRTRGGDTRHAKLVGGGLRIDG